MLEFILGLIIGATFAEFWRKLYLKLLLQLKQWVDSQPKREPPDA